MGNYPKINIGVGALVINNDNRIALIRRQKNPDLWAIPSGYLEEDENIYQTNIREVKEETNLKIEIEGIVGLRQRITDWEGNNLWIITLTKVISGEIKPDLAEITESKYFTIDQSLQLNVRPSTKKLFELLKENKLKILNNAQELAENNYQIYL